MWYCFWLTIFLDIGSSFSEDFTHSLSLGLPGFLLLLVHWRHKLKSREYS
jgi:hypothetical protein